MKNYIIKFSEEYKRYAPHLDDSKLPTPQEKIENRKTLMEKTGLLKEITIKKYLWQDRLTSDKYISLLNTQSQHRLLPEADREKLFNKIKQIIDNYGGTIEKQQMVALFLARAKKGF